jgi:hypothetical protein
MIGVDDDIMLTIAPWQQAGDLTPDDIADEFALQRPWYMGTGQPWEWSIVADAMVRTAETLERRFRSGPLPDPARPFKHGALPECC